MSCSDAGTRFSPACGRSICVTRVIAQREKKPRDPRGKKKKKNGRVTCVENIRTSRMTNAEALYVLYTLILGRTNSYPRHLRYGMSQASRALRATKKEIPFFLHIFVLIEIYLY